jgi:hypothetical protein
LAENIDLGVETKDKTREEFEQDYEKEEPKHKLNKDLKNLKNRKKEEPTKEDLDLIKQVKKDMSSNVYISNIINKYGTMSKLESLADTTDNNFVKLELLDILSNLKKVL